MKRCYSKHQKLSNTAIQFIKFMYFVKSYRQLQAHNQLGTPEMVKSFLRGTQFF